MHQLGSRRCRACEELPSSREGPATSVRGGAERAERVREGSATGVSGRRAHGTVRAARRGELREAGGRVRKRGARGSAQASAALAAVVADEDDGAVVLVASLWFVGVVVVLVVVLFEEDRASVR